MVLEQQYVNNTGGNISLEWIEIDNKSGTIGGDFNWDVDLGLGAAGTEIMRVRLVDTKEEIHYVLQVN